MDFTRVLAKNQLCLWASDWHVTHVSVWQGKVGSAFTSVGGHGRGFGGHEAILQSFHATFLQHGMVRTPLPLTHISIECSSGSANLHLIICFGIQLEAC